MTTSVIVTSPDGQEHGFQSMREAGEFIGTSTITVYRYGHGFKGGVYGGFQVKLLKNETENKKIQNVGDVYKRIEQRRKELGHPIFSKN